MLKTIDETEDFDFQEGETIFDTDGNVFTVTDGHACLMRQTSGLNPIRYNLATIEMRHCFTRKVPARIRCPGCGISVFPPSDAKTPFCSSCERNRA
jgi:hypothetical protein